jgi:hypothetical protein
MYHVGIGCRRWYYPDSYRPDINLFARAEPVDITGGGGKKVRFANELVQNGLDPVEIPWC